MNQVSFPDVHKLTDQEIESFRSTSPVNFELQVAYSFMYTFQHNIPRAEHWLRLGASKNNLKCLKWLNIGIIRDVIKGDKKQAIDYLSKLKNDYTIRTRILTIENLSSDIITDEKFIYGRLIMLETNLNTGPNREKMLLQIYTETVQKVKKSLFCFLWIYKKNKFFCKDLRILIGQNIWESRFQAGTIWGSLSSSVSSSLQ